MLSLPQPLDEFLRHLHDLAGNQDIMVSWSASPQADAPMPLVIAQIEFVQPAPKAKAKTANR